MDNLVKTFLHGLVANPLTQADRAAIEAMREGRPLTDVFLVPDDDESEVAAIPPRSHPLFVDASGEETPTPPPGAYVRVRTNDAFVTVIEHRPTGRSGDFDQSIKMYGPFVTADEQREFIRNVARAYFAPGPKRDFLIAGTDRWRRYDEDE